MGIITRRHRRALATLPVGAALVATALVGLPAHAAVTGPIDCPDPLPTADAVKGLTGTGYTVSEGDAPEAFTATVLGRITDGIGPGVDMIMAELDSPALDAAGGVWAGMSGSPVYTADGHLIGAVSYGLAASSPIAGITPAATMVPLLTGDTPTAGNSGANLPSTIKVNSSQAQTIVKASGVSSATASRGFKSLTLPLGVSGTPSKYGQKVLDRFEKKAGRVAMFTGSGKAKAAVAASSVPEVHAGGNFAGVLSYGDASFYGVGTTTFVCNGRAVAFGHPFDYSGDTSLGANLADVIYVQPDPVYGPFKVANIGDTVGTVNYDSLTGIAATLGAAPAGMVPVTTTLKNQSGKVFHGSTSVAAADFLPDIAAYGTLYDVERALGASSKGTANVTITIKGKRANGSAFTVIRKSGQVSNYNLAYDLADTVYILTDALVNQDLEKVKLTSISMEGSVTRAVKGYKASKLQVYRNGAWRNASSGPFLVRSKGKLNTRVTLTSLDGSVKKTASLMTTIPSVSHGSSGSLTFSAGSDPWWWDFSDADTFSELLAEIKALPVSNALYADIVFQTEKGTKITRASRATSIPVLEFEADTDLYAR